MVSRKIRRDCDKLRTFLQRLDDRFSRLNAVFFGRYGLGGNNSMAGLDVAAHCGRNCAQIYASRLLAQLLERRPGQEGRIDIHMENGPFRIHRNLTFNSKKIRTTGKPVVLIIPSIWLVFHLLSADYLGV